MKKYFPLLAIILFIAGIFVWAAYIMEQQQREAARELYEKQRHIVVYSSLPGDVNQALERAFYADTHLRVNIQTREEEQIARQEPSLDTSPDVVIAPEQTLRLLAERQILLSYASARTDAVPERYKDKQGTWIGLWLNPMVFVVSRDYYARQGMQPLYWDDLLTNPQIRIVFPDLAAMDMAGDFLCSFVEMRGLEQTGLYLRTLQNHVTAYSQSTSAIVRRIASGDADIGISDAAIARQFRQDGMPVYVLYPADGTSYWLTGAAVTRACQDEELADTFMDWLFSAHVDTVFRQHHLYFSYTDNENANMVDDQGRQLQLFPVEKKYTAQGRRELQDWWIKFVRFGKDQ